MRNLLAHHPQGDKSLVAATVRTIFARPNRAAAHMQVDQVAHMLDQHSLRAAALLRSAETDILAYMSFPRALDPDLLDQPFGTPESRGQTAHRRSAGVSRR